MPRGAAGERAGRARRDLARAGSGAGHAPPALPGEVSRGGGRARAAPGAHAPGLATATALPNQLVFPSKEGKAAGEQSYAVSRAQTRPAVLRVTTLQQRHGAAEAVFTSFLTKKCFPCSRQQSPRSSSVLPTATSCPLPGIQSICCSDLHFIKYFALFTEAQGSEGIPETFH